MGELHMDWMKKQVDRAINAQNSMLNSERDHRDRLTKHPDVAETYDAIIRDDEKDLNRFKEVGRRYGIDKPSTEGGGIFGGLRSRVERKISEDAFQSIGDDLTVKSSARVSDLVWKEVFNSIGDSFSASVMDEAAADCENHENILKQTVTNVGVMEAQGEMFEED